MEPIHLFTIATKQAEWLAVRQKAVAGNIANANTPNYQTRDVQPFSAVLNKEAIGMTQTDVRHMDIAGNRVEAAALAPEKTGETTHSGNTVQIEDELQKGSEIAREMSLNTAIVKSFHRLMMATVKGG